MEFEKAQIKILPWNSNKRKLAVSHLDWQPDTSFKLRDIVTSKYRGYYGQAKACKLTPGQLLCPVDTTQREAINLKENVMTEINSVKMSLEEEGLEAIRVSSGDLIKSGDLQSTLVNENKTEKNRRARLEEWLTAKGKTPHTVKRNVRRETFDVVRLSPELEQCVPVDEDARLERSEVDVNCALDECLHSCLGFMNEIKNESKVSDWLEELHERCPQVRSRALFWVCRAKVAERACFGQQHVLALYEQAIDHKAKPTDILKSVLQDFTIRYSQRMDTTPCATPKLLLGTPGPVSSSTLKYCTTPKVEEGTSSVVRYSLVKSTPIVNRLNKSMDGSSQRFLVTPVRRSIRLEKIAGRGHSTSRGNNRCISSLQDLPADMESLIMKPNRALEEEFMGTIDE
ncbi:uncharacterized protein LOC117107342 isoform X2 [Anneissia japonica]|uniref:uncharacterized protein LOC117107342 isoform X2 n=1 Tax=Anneissia japonica TaxID=1529436 RepID=UPI001425B391|nr:uncharacterized protein LOC117107342 isoform X2 [Anneissia japonica]